MRAVVPPFTIFLGVLVGCGSSDQRDGFKETCRVPESALVFVHGHRIEGEAVFEWVPGDTLRLNGLPIKPVPPKEVIGRTFSDERLEALYMRNPYAVRVADSLGW